MKTIRIVFYHTKDILKGKGLRIYLALFLVSMMVMLYMETLQLLMDVDGTPYMIVSVLVTFLNIVINYIVLFLFLKVVRKEKLTWKDVRYGFSKMPIFMMTGLLLSFLQLALFTLCAFFASIYPIYLILYISAYTIFVIWNGVVAFGVYDDASFTELLSSGPRIMMDHALELLSAACLLMIWRVLAELMVRSLFEMILGNSMYGGLFIASIMKGTSIGVGAMLGATLVNLLYYGVQYACMLPLYTYLAKIYDDEKTTYVPNARRLIER